MYGVGNIILGIILYKKLLLSYNLIFYFINIMANKIRNTKKNKRVYSKKNKRVYSKKNKRVYSKKNKRVYSKKKSVKKLVK